MTQLIADREDIDFVLHQQLQIEELSQNKQFAEFGKKVVNLIVSEARNLAIKEILPTLKVGDEIGCRFEKGVVTVPEAYQRPWALLKEGGWLAMSRDPQWGGQSMPETLSVAAKDYLIGANMSLMLLGALTHGAARLIELFGNDMQKKLYLEKMYSGKWTGTMLLTESDAGSDLGALTTTAKKNPDGTYSIAGNKIFISYGDHELAKNIVHPVLARIEGAPTGSRAISMFLVPKFHVDDDGSLGARNDIVCTGIEKKMGIHGSPTCSMALGEKGDCLGTLLGEENKGLAAMFVMMNESRLTVGSQSLACASSSYLHALEYARKRIQGIAVGATDNEPKVIIKHPDVRRMLLTMKMYVEGMRSLIYYIAYCEDKKGITDDEAAKQKYRNLIDILIPIGKGYVSDRAVELCSMGIQVLGGYGYTRDYPVEQLLRDVRICPIYEGTNGIQALDLMGRKLVMNNSQLFSDLLTEIHKIIELSKKMKSMEGLNQSVESVVDAFNGLTQEVAERMGGPEGLQCIANAAPFLQVTGDVVMAWMLLWRASIAAENIEKGAKKKNLAFYEGQIKSAEFFAESVLPITHGRIAAIKKFGKTVIEISDEAFGGK